MKNLDWGIAGSPKCDACGRDAMYDVPTTFGAWAYLCGECFLGLSDPDLANLGYRFRGGKMEKRLVQAAFRATWIIDQKIRNLMDVRTSIEELISDTVLYNGDMNIFDICLWWRW